MKLRRTISTRLLQTLAAGVQRLDGAAQGRIREFVTSQRGAASGFFGPVRADGATGSEDIYYTLFGRMLEFALGVRPDAVAQTAYLAGVDPHAMDLIHYAAWVRCVMLQRLTAGPLGALKLLLGRERLPELPAEVSAGASEGDAGSPYSLFVRLSLAEDSGRQSTGRKGRAEAESLLHSLQNYRSLDGGYSNLRGAVEATTNATAAALAVAGQLQGYRRGPESAFLRDLQGPSGGFAATTTSPVPDLLSTATALFTLRQYGERVRCRADDFVEAHWLENGGFSATLLDAEGDVEYTFYGLLALGAI